MVAFLEGNSPNRSCDNTLHPFLPGIQVPREVRAVLRWYEVLLQRDDCDQLFFLKEYEAPPWVIVLFFEKR